MVSRALLSRALRFAVRPPRTTRCYATVHNAGPLTEITTLANGLTVATEAHPHAQSATVGVWVDACSRAETEKINGTAHFLEHMAFKGTGRRTQYALELEVENLGAHLNAYTSREQTVDRERKGVILREQEEVDKQLKEVVFDHLHAVAFQGQPLGRTILEVRIRDDDTPTANIAIAIEGVSWSSPDYFSMMVMRCILGNWDRSLGLSSLTSSRLSHIISQHNLANSFMSFSTSYSDIGLWEWMRMSVGVTEIEVERAKSQLKASLLLSLDGTTAIAGDIGRQLVTTGRRLTPQQIKSAVDAVTVSDIKRVALKYIWDKDFALAAVGSIEGLLDYNRIRADMASLLY